MGEVQRRLAGILAADVVGHSALVGDGVIIAARLEPLAEPGSVCISTRAREDAAGKMALECDDLGTPELKNIAAKLQVFRVRLDPATAGQVEEITLHCHASAGCGVPE